MVHNGPGLQSRILPFHWLPLETYSPYIHKSNNIIAWELLDRKIRKQSRLSDTLWMANVCGTSGPDVFLLLLLLWWGVECDRRDTGGQKGVEQASFKRNTGWSWLVFPYKAFLRQLATHPIPQWKQGRPLNAKRIIVWVLHAEIGLASYPPCKEYKELSLVCG